MWKFNAKCDWQKKNFYHSNGRFIHEERDWNAKDTQMLLISAMDFNTILHIHFYVWENSPPFLFAYNLKLNEG